MHSVQGAPLGLFNIQIEHETAKASMRIHLTSGDGHIAGFGGTPWVATIPILSGWAWTNAMGAMANSKKASWKNAMAPHGKQQKGIMEKCYGAHGKQ